MIGATMATDRTFFGHPRGLAVLFFTELWERFGFYGMRALLILYLTGQLGYDASEAGALYALYTSAVYLVGLPGGWLADRMLGQQRAVLWGGLLLAAGYLSLAVPGLTAFYGGLAVIVVGTGLLKPNISAIVGKLYATGDGRRDAGFSIFYMGINVGALLGPLVCSYLGENVDWRLGFAAAGVGMSCGVLVYLGWRSRLGQAGLHPSKPADTRRAALEDRRIKRVLAAAAVAVAGAVGLVVSGVVTVDVVAVSDYFGLVLALVTVAFFLWLFLGVRWTPIERGRLAAIVVLFVAASIFWGAYEQAGSSLNLFADQSTDRSIPGSDRRFPAGWFQQAPALFVILLAPVFAWLWVRLGPRQPSSPAKFALGLVFVGLGFVVMVGAAGAAASGRPVSPAWLIGTYFLHVVGEMCLSPVGLGTVTKLAPERATGMMLGVWFLASAVGNYVGGRAAGFYETFPLWKLFGLFAVVAIGAGLLLAWLTPPIRRLMGGIH
ncbi:MAG TPA: peptide MFS transporter [Candidatus Polarisedimenticolaceae bacterium]|nr:peptide MFS transporter [Candidatus Polarisedimenticolaceae bacterium]